MKKTRIAAAAAALCLAFTGIAGCVPAKAQTQWDLSVSNEITDEMKDVFEDASEKLLGVNYEPVAVLGTQAPEEGTGTVICFLSRATPVYPDAEASYVLMYVREEEDGGAEVQNIWELWVEAHAEPTTGEAEESLTE